MRHNGKDLIMKTLKTVIILGFSTIFLFGALYPLAMVGIGKLIGSAAEGKPIFKNGQLIGFELIGQPFTSERYFWGRPSAVNYDAASTGGSNLSPTNSDYLAEVQNRMDTILKYHSYLNKKDIPIDWVTASGGGLDPHISKQTALLQTQRIAKARNLSEDAVRELIDQHNAAAWLRFFGPKDYVNVLKLNIALDELQNGTKQ